MPPVQHEEHEPRDRRLLPLQTDAHLHLSLLNYKTHNAEDYSADGYDMTLVGAPIKERNGMTFDGASNYLRRAEADWQGGDTFGVLSCWIKLNTAGVVNRIFSTADEATDNSYWVLGITAANLLTIEVNIGGVARSVVGDTALVADQWYFISAMSDGGTWGAYVNAVWQTLTPAGAGNDGSWIGDVDDRDNVCVGALRTNTILEYCDGTIKDLRYYGLYVQNASDVTYDYVQGVPDDDLAFHTLGGVSDLSRYCLPITRWNGPVVGHEMTFNGTNNSIETTAVELLTGAAVSFWFDADADEEAVLFNDVPHADRRLVVKTYAGGELRAGYWQGAVYRAASGTGYEINRWHHIYCSTDTDDTCRLWLDGIELTNAVDPSSGNGINLRLGASSSGSGNFNGRMRDVSMWQADKGEDFGRMLYLAQRVYY